MAARSSSSTTPTTGTITAPLARLLADLAARGAIVAASSEGGLFEYGTDDAIVANLTVLARAGVPIVAGSVTSSSEVRKRMIAQTRFRLFARGLEGFAPLAERSGYAIADSHTAVLSEQVLLRPRAPPMRSDFDPDVRSHDHDNPDRLRRR